VPPPRHQVRRGLQGGALPAIGHDIPTAPRANLSARAPESRYALRGI
jgi:hypothetical protein